MGQIVVMVTEVRKLFGWVAWVDDAEASHMLGVVFHHSVHTSDIWHVAASLAALSHFPHGDIMNDTEDCDRSERCSCT